MTGSWMCPACLEWVMEGKGHLCPKSEWEQHKPLVGGEVAPKETHEDIMRSLEEVDQAAKRISLIHDQPFGGAERGPVCAHLVVGYVRQYLGGGRERGWWQCAECDCKFVPSGTTKA